MIDADQRSRVVVVVVEEVVVVVVEALSRNEAISISENSRLLFLRSFVRSFVRQPQAQLEDCLAIYRILLAFFFCCVLLLGTI